MVINPQHLIDSGQLSPNRYGEVAQVGYDCTVKSIFKINNDPFDPSAIPASGKTTLSDRTIVRTILFDDDISAWRLAPGAYSLEFDQGCDLSDAVCGWFRARSSLVRAGAFIVSGVYDPGFKCDTMGAVLHTAGYIIIEQHARVAQFIAFRADAAGLYDGQWQGEKDVK